MKRVRIIEFLRDCPVYTRLYSPLYGYCEFLECSQNFIFVRGSKVGPKYNKCHDVIYKFNEIGQPCGTIHEDNEIVYSECMLFPSHTYRSWKNWQIHLFKESDMIYRNHPLMGIPYCTVFKVKGFNGKYLECIDKDNANISILNTELKNYRYATKGEQISFRELPYRSDVRINDTKEPEVKGTIKNESSSGLGRYKLNGMVEVYYTDVCDDDKLATEAIIRNTKIVPPEGFLIGKITPIGRSMFVEFVDKISKRNS